MIRESMSADVRVIELPGDRLAEAAGVLARSFQTNPNFVDLFLEEEVRTRVLPHVFAAGLRDALGFGHVYAAVRGDEIVGVATWLPPGTFPLSLRRQFRVLPDMVRILAAAPRSIPRLMRFMASVNALHPTQPYWYLENIGVEPAAQGLGAGTRLLEPVLALADAAGQPCYLETQTERNAAWYRKLGFEIRDAEVSFTPGGPPNWTMLRHPRQR
jgi:ribosomal protein S18 acetylase RimI-like enzyme